MLLSLALSSSARHLRSSQALSPNGLTPKLMCSMDVHECPDGSFVGRDAINDCEFKRCHASQLPQCTEDAKKCEDGSFVVRDPHNNCRFTVCPRQSSLVCTMDVQQCPDGSYVSRDFHNFCKFKKCPREVFCTRDVHECPDGSFVGRDSANRCEFKPCAAAPGGTWWQVFQNKLASKSGLHVSPPVV